MFTVLSPCKLNLFLYVTSKREDGFHNLQSIFCLLNHGDTMSFAVQNDHLGKINLLQDMGFKVTDNLIYKAAKLLQDYTNQKFSVTVDIDKILPMGGGLGGGSSNAATTLLILNHLLHLNLTVNELSSLGAQLGSDVPFFIQGHNAFVEGRGEIIKPHSLEPAYYLVLTPPCHISTKEIFTSPNIAQYYSPQRSLEQLLALPFTNNLVTIVRQKYPKVDQTLKALDQYASAKMSGTGASCFAKFDTLEQAQEIQTKLSYLNVPSFIAPLVNTSPVLEAISQA